MSVKLLTGHHSEFLRLKGGCTGSSVSTLVKIPHCWKSLVMALFYQFMKLLDMLTLCMLGNGVCLFVATADFLYFMF